MIDQARVHGGAFRGSAEEPYPLDAYGKVDAFHDMRVVHAVERGHGNCAEQCMEGCVEQRGMQQVVGRLRLEIRVQPHHAERFVLAATQRLDALEKRSVLESRLLECPVELGFRYVHRAARSDFGDRQLSRQLAILAAAKLPSGMTYPLLFAPLHVAIDAERRLSRIAHELHGKRIVRQHDAALQRQLLDDTRTRAEELASRGQRHLDVRGGGKDHGVLHAMVTEVAERMAIELARPRRVGRLLRAAKERMHLSACALQARLV